MATTATVHVRVDEKLKERASVRLAQEGLTIADAVRLMLERVTDGRAVRTKKPNATTVRAMQSLERGGGHRFAGAEALFEDLGI